MGAGSSKEFFGKLPKLPKTGASPVLHSSVTGKVDQWSSCCQLKCHGNSQVRHESPPFLASPPSNTGAHVSILHMSANPNALGMVVTEPRRMAARV